MVWYRFDTQRLGYVQSFFSVLGYQNLSDTWLVPILQSFLQVTSVLNIAPAYSRHLTVEFSSAPTISARIARPFWWRPQRVGA